MKNSHDPKSNGIIMTRYIHLAFGLRVQGDWLTELNLSAKPFENSCGRGKKSKCTSKTTMESLHNYSTVLYYTILYYTILYYTILCYAMLCYAMLCYAMLCYAILCYTILYYTILYYTILYYTILYYTILYYTILYYTILYYTILYEYYSNTSHLRPRAWSSDASMQNL